MSVFKENGSWFVRYRDLEGKQREKKAGATKALALELERKILAERDFKKRFGYTTLKEITFNDWADQYLDICRTRIALSTCNNRQYELNKMKKLFGDKFLSKLTENNFYDYVKTTKGGITGRTVGRYAKFFLAILSEAKKYEYNVATITLNIKRKSKIVVRYLTKEEAEELIKNSGDLRLLIIMALNTGMRRGEMLNLMWNNIDLKTRLIHIEESKNGERRSVPINTTLFNELNKEEDKTGKVIKLPLTVDGIKYKFKGLLRQCNITNFRFHDLRHTFASWLAIKGVSLYTIKELLGHKSILMTQRYAHLSPDVRFNAVEMIKL